MMLCQALANEQVTDDIRQSAAIALKNTLTAKVRHTKGAN
jgi:hypothetical protein